MTLPKSASPEARRKKHAANRRGKARLAERIEDRRLYEHELAEPSYYNDIERELRTTLPEFELDVTPDRTTCRWRGLDGTKFVIRANTRPGALLRTLRESESDEGF